jgi:hypothetical protein
MGAGKRGGGKECGVVIDLDGLVKYRHLSFAWFARTAVAWLVGQDPFEEPVPIGEVLEKAVREAGALGLGGGLLEDLRSSEPGNLGVDKHFMRWESKEFMRVFGGGGGNVKDYFCARKYVIGLSMLGRELTRAYGSEYLLMEPHAYLRYLGLAGYRELYSTTRDFVREYERRRAKKERNISETAFMTTLAGLIISKLHKYGVGSYAIGGLIEAGGGAFALYLVSRGKMVPLDLTRLVKSVLGLEGLFGLGVSRVLGNLAGWFVNRRRGGGIIDSINLVGEAVFKYTVTGDLGYVYNMIRTVATSEDYTWVLKPLLGGVGGVGGEGGD